MSQVEVRHHGEQSRFEAVEDGAASLGFLEYEVDGDVHVYSHTVVRPEAKGKGVGSALAKTALDHARTQGWQVVAQCQFVRSFIDEHAEYNDLVVD